MSMKSINKNAATRLNPILYSYRYLKRTFTAAQISGWLLLTLYHHLKKKVNFGRNDESSLLCCSTVNLYMQRQWLFLAIDYKLFLSNNIAYTRIQKMEFMMMEEIQLLKRRTTFGYFSAFEKSKILLFSDFLKKFFHFSICHLATMILDIYLS